MAIRRNRSKCPWSMEWYLHKGWLMVFFLHLCQAQDAAPPSPNPEPAPPSLVDVIDAVKAAFEQAVKISKDDAVREVFEQVVEELVPQQDKAGQSSTTADDAKDETEDALAAVVHELAKEGAEGLTSLNGQAKATLDSSEQLQVEVSEDAVEDKAVLVQDPAENPMESGYLLNNEKVLQKQEEPVSESLEESIEEPVQEPEESVQRQEELDVEMSKQSSRTDPGEISEDKDLGDQSVNVPDESPEQVALPIDSARERKGKEVGEQAEGDGGKLEQKIEILQEQETRESGGVGEAEVGDGKEEVKDIIHGAAKVHKRKPERKLSKMSEEPEQITESQPGQHQEHGILEGAMLVQDKWDEGEERGAVVIIGDLVEAETGEENMEVGAEEARGKAEFEDPMENTEVLSAKTTMVQHTSRKEVEVVLDAERTAPVEDEPQGSVITRKNSMDDVTQETNDMNDIVTSKDFSPGPVELNQAAPTSENEALPPFPSQGIELGGTDELVEEPAENTQITSPGKDVWKIGAIAAAFFLILQTVITVVYILRCKRKPNSRVGTVRACEEGNGGNENNMANTGTPTVPAEEQPALDDLPEYSEVQREAVAMTTITARTSSKEL